CRCRPASRWSRYWSKVALGRVVFQSTLRAERIRQWHRHPARQNLQILSPLAARLRPSTPTTAMESSTPHTETLSYSASIAEPLGSGRLASSLEVCRLRVHGCDFWLQFMLSSRRESFQRGTQASREQ